MMYPYRSRCRDCYRQRCLRRRSPALWSSRIEFLFMMVVLGWIVTTTTTMTSVVTAYRFADYISHNGGDYDNDDGDDNHNNDEKTTRTSSTTSSTEGYEEEGRNRGMIFLADLEPPTSTTPCYQHSWKRTNDLLKMAWWDENAGFHSSSTDDVVVLPSASHDDDHHQHPVRGEQQNHYHSYGQNDRAWTYGEVTILGGRQLAYAMGISSSTTSSSNCDDSTTATTCQECQDNDDNDDNEKDKIDGSRRRRRRRIIFYDLGSGVGRLVAQMYFDQPWMIEKSIGIELAIHRHEWAIQALSYLEQAEEAKDDDDDEEVEEEHDCQDDKDKPPENGYCSAKNNNNYYYNTTITTRRTTGESQDEDDDDEGSSSRTIITRRIQYYHGDILDSSWTWREDATHIFLSSLCFPPIVLDAIQRQILGWNDNSGRSSSSSLQVVASLKRLDLLKTSDEWEEDIGDVHIQMSWGPGIVKIYRRVGRPE